MVLFKICMSLATRNTALSTNCGNIETETVRKTYFKIIFYSGRSSSMFVYLLVPLLSSSDSLNHFVLLKFWCVKNICLVFTLS